MLVGFLGVLVVGLRGGLRGLRAGLRGVMRDLWVLGRSLRGLGWSLWWLRGGLRGLGGDLLGLRGSLGVDGDREGGEFFREGAAQGGELLTVKSVCFPHFPLCKVFLFEAEEVFCGLLGWLCCGGVC